MEERIEIPSDFYARHGKPFEYILSLDRARRGTGTNIWIFPTGALLTHNGYAPTLREPDPNPTIRHLWQVRYWRMVKQRAERDHHHLDCALRGVAEPFKWPTSIWGPAPRDETAALTFLRSMIEEASTKLATLGEPATIPT